MGYDIQRFQLVRAADPSGVSGIGIVAEGVRFADGHVALRWVSDHPATSIWATIADLLAVHGHGGATTVRWLDPQPAPGSSDGASPPSPGRHRAERATDSSPISRHPRHRAAGHHADGVP